MCAYKTITKFTQHYSPEGAVIPSRQDKIFGNNGFVSPMKILSLLLIIVAQLLHCYLNPELLYLHLLQLTSYDNEIFEAVVAQVDLPRGYTHAMLKDDMIKYLNKNSDFFTVTKQNYLFLVLTRFQLLCDSTVPIVWKISCRYSWRRT